MLTGYCAGWSLRQLIKEGLGGVPGKITSSPASHLSTLCNQMVNFLGIMQNEWAGAQAFSSFDTYLAPFVKADNLSYKEVKQCIQSFVYGVNTPSRWGCVPIDTEVLSVDGFKKYNELKEGDQIYTWNMNTHNLELNTVRKVITKDFEGNLHSYKNGNGYEQLVTPNHRMLVYKHNSDEAVIRKSEEIFKVRTPYVLPTRFSDSTIEGINLSDEEIKFAAIIYADGSFEFRNNNVHRIRLYKSKFRDGNDEIVDLCQKLGLEYTLKTTQSFGKDKTVNCYQFYSDSAKKIVELTGQKTKIKPEFLKMNQRQAKLFLKTWCRFDGKKDKFAIQCDNDDIINAIQQIAILAGYTSYLTYRNKTTYVKIRQYKYVIPKERTEVPYKGLVWCPNVENGTAVFRRNGNIFISGQTQAPFTNITLDWVVPNDLAEMNAIVGGKEMDFKYKDCVKEMAMVNKAFIEIMIEGDANGRGFQYPIPTYSITRDFDWSETENNKLLFEMTAKYGTPYFSNYINSDMEPSDVRSMCCRLRLDLRELRKKSGGFFGSGESTGSVGVVTINMPRIAYLSATEEEFYDRLKHLMDISARSLKVKRDTITKLLDAGLYPYTKRYLGTFANHFSTIGLVGMNEACLNAKWIKKDLTQPEAQVFTKNVLNFMRNKLSDYQELYGDLYNLEATPAESTSFRLAKHDKKRYPDIITASDCDKTPYYTNSSHLPVGFTDDIFSALDIQDELQTLYTSGTVFHAFLGQKLPDWKAAATLVRKIAENYKLPYYTMSPTYSVCADHGYIAGEVYQCPVCGKTTEVYSRITGYYRPVQNWNDGKRAEFAARKVYDVANSHFKETCEFCGDINIPEDIDFKESYTTEVLTKPLLFTRTGCPNCKTSKMMLDKAGIKYDVVNAEEAKETTLRLGIKKVPTLLVPDGDNFKVYDNASEIRKYIESIT